MFDILWPCEVISKRLLIHCFHARSHFSDAKIAHNISFMWIFQQCQNHFNQITSRSSLLSNRIEVWPRWFPTLSQSKARGLDPEGAQCISDVARVGLGFSVPFASWIHCARLVLHCSELPCGPPPHFQVHWAGCTITWAPERAPSAHLWNCGTMRPKVS